MADFDIFVGRFEGGRQAPADRDAFEAVFGDFAAPAQGDTRRLIFDDGGNADARFEDGTVVFSGFRGPRFVALLFDFMRACGGAAYWPGERPTVAVADAGLLAGLPLDLKALTPATVGSAEALRAVLPVVAETAR